MDEYTVGGTGEARRRIPGGGTDIHAYEKERLEELRMALRAENISYGELAELQSLAEFIEDGDVELLEPAGVPEFPEERDEPTNLTERIENLLASLDEIEERVSRDAAPLHETLNRIEDARGIAGELLTLIDGR